MGDDRFAQVALQYAADVDAILHQHRLVQPIGLEQRRVAHRVNAAFTRQRLNRVARDHANQKKGQQRHPEKCRDDQAQAGEEET